MITCYVYIYIHTIYWHIIYYVYIFPYTLCQSVLLGNGQWLLGNIPHFDLCPGHQSTAWRRVCSLCAWIAVKVLCKCAWPWCFINIASGDKNLGGWTIPVTWRRFVDKVCSNLEQAEHWVIHCNVWYYMIHNEFIYIYYDIVCLELCKSTREPDPFNKKIGK